MSKYIGVSVPRVDGVKKVTGAAKYVGDMKWPRMLYAKCVKSPYAHAKILSIDVSAAKALKGVHDVITGDYYTKRGGLYLEDKNFLAVNTVKFCGEPVVAVAAETPEIAEAACELVKVEYEPLPVINNPMEGMAKDAILIHPELHTYKVVPIFHPQAHTNISHHHIIRKGDADAAFKYAEEHPDEYYITEHEYHVPHVQHTPIENHIAVAQYEPDGKCTVWASCQSPYAVRQALSASFDIPLNKMRIISPYVGGGFGAKQTSVCEVYPAFVTWKTKKPSKIIFSRYESQIASTPRHEMELHVRLGATKDGIVRGIDLYTLSNTGAYGEHGPTTVGLSGHKSIPLYGKAEAFRFVSDVVYTNHMSAGAYRGYGATQGLFAVESAVNELADKLGIDPFVIRQRNIVHEGDVMPAYYGQVNTSCALDRCLQAVHDNIGWDEKYPVRDMGNGKVRAVGMGMAMQGSGITSVDVGSASLKINDDGFYTLSIGAADMGTGCDTILAQIAAEVLDCPLDNVTVLGADTDSSPYDSGSYASSTTYVTGKAVEQCAEQLKQKICQVGAGLLGLDERAVVFAGDAVTSEDGTQRATLAQIAAASQCGSNTALEAVVTHSSEISPPPFMVGAAEVEVDLETGEAQVIRYEAAVDCGTPVNPNLARVQAEGGILQGIGMALTENVTYDDRGMPQENSLMQYKIPARNDIGHIHVVFESSYEGTGPFGAKSIGEVVINTPLPAVADAIYHATHKRFYELPITREQIALAGQ